MRIFLLLMILCFSTMADLKDAVDKSAKILSDTRNELIKNRADNNKARKEMLKEESNLKEKVSKNNKALNDLLGEISAIETDIKQLEKKIEEDEDLFKKLDKLLIETDSVARTWLLPSELKLFKNNTKGLKGIEKLNAVSSQTTEILSNTAAIRVIKGTIQDSKDNEVSGSIILVGNIAELFISDDKKLAGIIYRDTGSVINRVEPFNTPEDIKALDDLTNGTASVIPFDLSGGVHLQFKAGNESLFEHIKKGGATVYPLLLLGLICLIAGLYKSFQLFTVSTNFDKPTVSVIEALKENNSPEEAAEAVKGPMKDILVAAVQYKDVDKEQLEEILSEMVISKIPKYDRYLSLLSVGAAAAPLLGLLGTVMGIIKTFSLISVYGTGDAGPLSSGISEALISTEVGLCVAIPCLIWFTFLNRRLRTIIGNMEKSVLSFLNAQYLHLEEHGKTND